MIRLFGILLYPIVFLVLYAVSEAIFPSRNAAMAISLLGAFPVCLLYVRVRTRLKEKSDGKKTAKASAEHRLSQLMLLSDESFEALFPDCLCDHSASGLNEEALLRYLRVHGCNDTVRVASLNALTPGADALASFLGVKLEVLSEKELLARVGDAELPEVPKKRAKRRLERFKSALKSTQTRRFCLRYSLLLALLSLLTPYRLYYLLAAGLLFALFAVGTVRTRLNRRNQIPVLRSE